jgi:hypothetical protein
MRSPVAVNTAFAIAGRILHQFVQSIYHGTLRLCFSVPGIDDGAANIARPRILLTLAFLFADLLASATSAK